VVKISPKRLQRGRGANGVFGGVDEGEWVVNNE